MDLGRGLICGVLEFEHPGPVEKLVLLMEFRVVVHSGLPHLPQDFEPALS